MTEISLKLFLVAFPLTGLVLGCVLLRVTAGRWWRRRVALCAPGSTHVLLAVLGAPALVVLSDGIYKLISLAGLPTIQYQAELEKWMSQFPFVFSVFVIAVGPAVAEEVWCRGFIGRGLVARYGYAGGVVLSSLFFGAMHLDPPHVVATFCMGVCLHCAYLASRSLWVPILLHFLNNGFGVLGVTILKDNAVLEALDPPPTILYPGAAALAMAVGWAFYASRARLAPPPDEAEPAWQPHFPGVEYPPPGSATRVVHPRPGWPVALAVVVFLLFFAALFFGSGDGTVGRR